MYRFSLADPANFAPPAGVYKLVVDGEDPYQNYYHFERPVRVLIRSKGTEV